MTPEAKSLKIISLITMFAGLLIAIAGIVLCVLDFDIADITVIVSGFLGTAVGATGARKANVPSSAKDIVKPALIVCVVCIAFCVISVFVKSGIPDMVADAVSGIFSANVSLAAKRIVKALEKI